MAGRLSHLAKVTEQVFELRVKSSLLQAFMLTVCIVQNTVRKL